MLVFLDFEATSTGRHGTPIEVAWVFETGEGEEHLIRPAPTWTDWDPRAQAVHGIERSELVERGRSHDWVAARMVEVLAPHRLFASAPSWDGKWLSRLLRDAGWPRHTLRLADTEVAQAEAVVAILHARGMAEPAAQERALALVSQTKHDLESRSIAHRALADARRERQIMIQACQAARELAL